MLTLPCYIQNLRWVVPASCLFAPAPLQYGSLVVWRAITCVFPRRVFEIGEEILWGTYQRLVLFFYEHYTNIELVLYGDARDCLSKRENIILIMNHQSTVDWVLADMLAVRQGSLNYIRYVLKDGLKFFPLYGIQFLEHNCVFVRRRKFKKNKAVDKLQSFVKTSIPFWMVVFPEGTRYNPSNHKLRSRSQSHAKKEGLTPLDNVLTPRTKGTWLCVKELRKTAAAVYDVTVAYSGSVDVATGTRIPARGLPEFLQNPHKEVHVDMKRIPMSDVPTDEKMFEKWLHDRFVRKDKLLQDFYSSPQAGTLGVGGQVWRLPLSTTLPVALLYAAATVPAYMYPAARDIMWKATAVLGVAGLVWVAVKA